MTPEGDDDPARLPKAIKVGLVLTLFVVLTAIIVGLGSACDANGVCTARWRLLLTAPANEVGDTLSGIGSVLAFIWLVMTAWMQSMELREQRQELRAQRAETAKMSEALSVQSEIFKKEQISREQEAADKELRAILSLCAELVAEAEVWVWPRSADGQVPALRVLGPKLPGEHGDREILRRIFITIGDFRSKYPEYTSELGPPEALPQIGASRQVLETLEAMRDIRPRLSSPAQIFLLYPQICEAAAELKQIVDDRQYWADEGAES